MIRVDAPPVFADVVDGHTLGDLLACVMCPRCSMGGDHLPIPLISPPNLGVTMGCGGIRGDPAALFVFDVFGCCPFCDTLGNDDRDCRFSIPVDGRLHA